MTRVLFIQQNHEEWLGVMSLSAMLKTRGHDCDILVEPLEKEDLATAAHRWQPDILAVSCLTSDYRWAVSRAGRIRRAHGPLVVFGGIHPTLDSEASLADPNVDVICRGEGELPLAELADAVATGGDWSSIANLWVTTDRGVVRNDMRDLTVDLDSLPFPDRNLYTRYRFFRERGKRALLLGRGCPFACAHCHNSAKKEVFRDKGPYVRWRSKENVLAEIGSLLESGSVRVLHFVDDSFGANRRWLIELVRELRGRYGSPVALQANMRADLVSDELCRVLREYGADKLRLRIAVETGDEDYRRRVLKKDISDEVLLRAADTLHRHGIDFVTYNMVGLPGESYSQALETVRFNCRLRPALALCFVFQPFPGTELARVAVRDGFLPEANLARLGSAEFGGLFHSRSPLRQPEIREIENLHAVFGLVVSAPYLLPLARILCRVTAAAPLFQIVYRGYIKWVLWRRRNRDAY